MTKARSKPASSSALQAAYRSRMRAQGLRQVQVWVPDLRKAELLERIHADVETIKLAQCNENERDIMRFIEAAYEWPEM